VLEGASTMRRISRDPEDLVAQTIGENHQYPDGFMLFLGTLFAPVADRDAPGRGFTHHVGDVVTVRSARLGALRKPREHVGPGGAVDVRSAGADGKFGEAGVASVGGAAT
jgi:fumarylacetoacetate (FAA) hydrolase family protein